MADTNWSDSGNWTNGVPHSGSAATASNGHAVTTDGGNATSTLAIGPAAGSQVNVADGTSLTTGATLANSGLLTFSGSFYGATLSLNGTTISGPTGSTVLLTSSSGPVAPSPLRRAAAGSPTPSTSRAAAPAPSPTSPSTSPTTSPTSPSRPPPPPAPATTTPRPPAPPAAPSPRRRPRRHGAIRQSQHRQHRPTGAYTEKLDGTGGATTGNATVSGSLTGLAAGSASNVIAVSTLPKP